MDPLHVDVVLATNRVSSYLADTIESVYRQTYPHWRLIVVDDGTPDPKALKAALGDFAGTMVRQTNRGVSAARNRGIALGDAPLIVLLDDDDLWAPSKLEEQVSALGRTPDAVAAFSAGRYIDANGREFGDGWPAVTVPSSCFVSGRVPAPRIVTMMVRRAAHEAVGPFDETYSLAEDNEYVLRLAILGEMVAVERPLTAYRRHNANASSADSLEGRHASRRMLREKLVAHRQNARIRSLLELHVARSETASAEECVRAMADAARRRDLARMMGELGWASGAPLRTAAALTRAVSRRR